MKRALEIRTYTLKPGAGAAFHNLFVKQSLPLLERWEIDVVAYGPSLHDSDAYYLMRSYPDLRGMQQAEAAFYGSDDWRQGPRETLISLIESYSSIVIEADEALLQQLRKQSVSRPLG
jgi:hypothetical protein